VSLARSDAARAARDAYRPGLFARLFGLTGARKRLEQELEAALTTERAENDARALAYATQRKEWEDATAAWRDSRELAERVLAGDVEVPNLQAGERAQERHVNAPAAVRRASRRNSREPGQGSTTTAMGAPHVGHGRPSVAFPEADCSGGTPGAALAAARWAFEGCRVQPPAKRPIDPAQGDARPVGPLNRPHWKTARHVTVAEAYWRIVTVSAGC
jgi:hypothetical protein